MTMPKKSWDDQTNITTNSSQTNMGMTKITSTQNKITSTVEENGEVNEIKSSIPKKRNDKANQVTQIAKTSNTTVKNSKIENEINNPIATQDVTVKPSKSIAQNVIDHKPIILKGITFNSFNESVFKSQPISSYLNEKTKPVLQENLIPTTTVVQSKDDLTSKQRSLLNTFDFIEAFNLRLAENETKVHRDQVPKIKTSSGKFNLGLMVGGFTHAAQNQSNAFYGGVGGITLRYRFHPLLSINTDLTYRFIKGDYEETQTNIQTSFGFGQTINEYSLRPKSMHQVSIPIYAQLAISRSILEGGISYNKLIGVKGEIKDKESLYPWQRLTMEEQIEQSKTSVLSEGWIDEEGFRADYFSLLMGYKYRLNTNMDIGLRAEYALKSILTNDESTTGMNQLSFGVHLNYYFIQ